MTDMRRERYNKAGTENIRREKEGIAMGRYYRLTKKITEKMAEDILKEILGMEDVEKAEFAEENTKILVVTAKEKYPDVMTRIVNIFSRVGKGCEILFDGFQVPEE